MSLGNSTMFSSSILSGAIYNSVPSLPIEVPSRTVFDTPKSPIFILLLFKNIFLLEEQSQKKVSN